MKKRRQNRRGKRGGRIVRILKTSTQTNKQTIWQNESSNSFHVCQHTSLDSTPITDDTWPTIISILDANVPSVPPFLLCPVFIKY